MNAIAMPSWHDHINNYLLLIFFQTSFKTKQDKTKKQPGAQTNISHNLETKNQNDAKIQINRQMSITKGCCVHQISIIHN